MSLSHQDVLSKWPMTWSLWPFDSPFLPFSDRELPWLVLWVQGQSMPEFKVSDALMSALGKAWFVRSEYEYMISLRLKMIYRRSLLWELTLSDQKLVIGFGGNQRGERKRKEELKKWDDPHNPSPDGLRLRSKIVPIKKINLWSLDRQKERSLVVIYRAVPSGQDQVISSTIRAPYWDVAYRSILLLLPELEWLWEWSHSRNERGPWILKGYMPEMTNVCTLARYASYQENWGKVHTESEEGARRENMPACLQRWSYSSGLMRSEMAWKWSRSQITLLRYGRLLRSWLAITTINSPNSKWLATVTPFSVIKCSWTLSTKVTEKGQKCQWRLTLGAISDLREMDLAPQARWPASSNSNLADILVQSSIHSTALTPHNAPWNQQCQIMGKTEYHFISDTFW